MSENRRTFPGIAQAWIARGDGKQKAFAFNAKTLSVFCDVDFLGDIAPLITLSEFCEVGFDGIKTDINIDTICATSKTGDIEPPIILSVQCAVIIS